MKKGERRKTNKKANRVRKPGHRKGKRQHKNPFAALDPKEARKLVNYSIGAALLAALDIDFIGIIEKASDDQP